MPNNQSKYGRRFDEEFKREVAALASQPGANQEQVARGLGVSPYSVSRWKKLYAGGPAGPSPGVNPQELERENRALRRENEDLREQRTILKKHSPLSRKPRAEAWRDQEFIKQVPRQDALPRAGREPQRLLRRAAQGRASARLGAKIKESFEASRRTYGSPRITVVLRRTGETYGRHRVARLVRTLRLRATQKRRFRPRTTDSRHLCPIAPNHLAERAEPPGLPGEVWQADITYVATREGWLYVAGVLDACSRRIVGWAAADSMPAGLVARAFERAVQARRPTPGLLHHSDRGSQYASDAYRELLRSHGVVPSMSRAGNCYDNAKMESFWATLKSELIQDRVFASRVEARSEIFRYIEVFYNRTRLHGALGYTSPVDFENSLS